jgi:hypothetical protein
MLCPLSWQKLWYVKLSRDSQYPNCCKARISFLYLACLQVRIESLVEQFDRWTDRWTVETTWCRCTSLSHFVTLWLTHWADWKEYLALRSIAWRVCQNWWKWERKDWNGLWVESETMEGSSTAFQGYYWYHYRISRFFSPKIDGKYAHMVNMIVIMVTILMVIFSLSSGDGDVFLLQFFHRKTTGAKLTWYRKSWV